MKISIELNDAGQLLVNGDCLQNKVMAIGMLELAKGMIAKPEGIMKPAAPQFEIAGPEATKALTNGRR